MAKIHPQKFTDSSNYMTSNRETFTVWLKSLIFHGNGCTVFNSKGEIVFRVDNYQERSCNEVFLMDFKGDVLFSIQRQKVRVFGRWNGYKWSSGSKANKETPWIQVRKSCRVLGGNTNCRVSMESAGILFSLVGSDTSSEFKIIDSEGRKVAEAKQKMSSKGVYYGDDVLSLVVEPHTDHLLILALMTIQGLINNKL